MSGSSGARLARRAAALVLGAAVLAPSAPVPPAGAAREVRARTEGQVEGQAETQAEPPAEAPVPEVIPAARHDLSPPLRRLARRAVPAPPRREVPLFRRPVPDVPGRAEAREAGAETPEAGGDTLETRAETPARPDPAVSEALAASLPPPALTFEGISNTDNAEQVLAEVVPPDTNGDVGPNHYMQITNVVYRVFDREGNSLLGPAPNNSVWAGFGGPCEETNDGDPIVLYDHPADRWLLSQFALPNCPPAGACDGPFFQCVAVSATGDPTDAWHRYQFKWSNVKLNDYPKFGVWPDGYYMSVNQFDVRTGLSFAGVGVAVLERSKMLGGQPARMVKFDLEDSQPNLFGFLPADLDGPLPPRGSPNPFALFEDDVFRGVPRDRLQVWELRTRWRNPKRSTFTRAQVLPTDAIDSIFSCQFDRDGRSCVPQPEVASNAFVDVISDRLMYRLQYRNMGTHEAMVVNHTVDVGSDRAGIRWYELRRTGGTWTIHQQATHAGDDPATDTEHRWMGSAALDGNGNLALGYSVSSDTVHPGIRYTGRLVSDPLDQLQEETSLIEGSGSQEDNRSRWGDYSMMAVDPTDECTFWYTQQYYETTSTRTWQTRVGVFGVPEDPDVAPPGSLVVTRPRGVWQTARRFPVSWTAADCQSGVAHHDVRFRRARFNGPWRPRVTWQDDTADTSATFPGRPGNTYCFDVRADDIAGNTSPFGADACTSLPVNNTALDHRGNWTKNRKPGHYLRTFSATRQKGARLVRRGVRAKRISLVVTTCRRCGVVEVRFRGNLLRTIDLRSSRVRKKRVINVRAFNRVRRGKVVVKVTSARKPVRIEGLGISRV